MNIAIIPARNGSKSICGKNTKPLGGMSLVHRAIQSVQSSKIFDQIVLTTDIVPLQEEFKGRLDVIERSPELCTDDATMVPVILDVIEKCSLIDDAWIWLIQPTSPFRTQKDYTNILEILESKPDLSSTSKGSVISVEHIPSHHPNRNYTISTHGLLMSILGKFAQFENRQKLSPVYHRNGCFYVTKVKEFKKWKSFYVPPCRPYIMDDVHSINIDSEKDWILAEALISRRIVK